MNKEILIKQKKELEYLLKKPYIPRQKMVEAKSFLDSDLVKVVIGPRRAGKSIFTAHLFKDKLPAYVNFDDESLVKLEDYDELIKELHSLYGQNKYLLFDEIQNLPNWELFINRLHREGYNLLLTGSNAKLLSQELATSLTGRHVPIEILPFNFKEYLKAKEFEYQENEMVLPEKKGILLNLLIDYMTNGGFPELVVKGLEPRGYLDTLLDSLIFKDIVKRHKLRLSEKIYDLELYFLNNFTAEFSYQKVSRLLGFSSVATLEKFVKYLEEAYLVYTLTRYSYKTGERLSSPKKAYLVDNGYISAKAVQYSPNNGKLMENLVFSELLKMGYQPNHSLFYYRTKNNKEVDFILREGLKVKTLIQAAYDLNGPDTEAREIKALIEAGGELKCNNLIVLTWDDEKIVEVNEQKIVFMPLWKWLIN
ncbi:ATPase [Candidatus Falkowbacteria bacterium CG10_big_fil_rev_8_21_14_0_10_39_9]|uniref:ATPase n=1 Tax=Candidatus Falkowbacteria bacterium CG10_big_fil_rev_8_21_14_0_10_39_9 TaxID=1974566 RepID=A0A2M6WQD9_9BACT|nr:MAG: ATPase [Candidatus Falkowbacteria bacterium CG10_big_fil_rev_8_21_14_0_10_39_9]